MADVGVGRSVNQESTALQNHREVYDGADWYSPRMAIRHDHPTPLDTSIEARRRQVAEWIAMGPEQRVRAAASMSDDVRRLSFDGTVARRAASTPKSAR